ncbi:MAG TPA: MMPL family transporter [Solirubrobacterales bacterium]|nr:MMPL family transporter [Solirubrobacterales bacterium]
MRGSMFTFPAGRRAKWVVFALWFLAIFAAINAKLPEKFEEAENNEATSYLPGDAESTKALAKTEELQKGEIAPTVVVFRRDSGLTAADFRTIEEDVAKMTEKRYPGVIADGETAASGGQERKPEATAPGDKPQGDGCGGPTTEVPGQAADYAPFVGPICSQDGKEAIVTSYINAEGEAELITDPVQDWRDLVSGERDGLEVKITGGGGFSTDAIEVFESLNGTLLLAAVSLVIFLLICIYRSPIFLFIPLIAVIFAEMLSRSIGYGVSELGVTINGQSSSIMSVLVLGAGTDYALLLVARYREELHHTEDKHEAMRTALESAGPAIFASALTVIAALLCLMLAKVNGTAGLGPIAAIGIACAGLSMLTLLPALLTICGRRAFWPFIPRYEPNSVGETEDPYQHHSFWARVGKRVAAGPQRVALGAVAVLLVCCAGFAFFSTELTSEDSYRTEVESVEGQELLDKSFPSGTTALTDVIVPEGGDVEAAKGAVEGVEGVESVTGPVASGPPGTLIQATLEPNPYSTEAFDLVEPMRDAADEAAPGTLVGGPSAVEFDVREAAAWDSIVIPPLILLVVFLILIALLRSVIAPLVLIGTVILSFLAALGVGYFVFDVIFGFPGSDPSLPLFAFVFLVALGVDYNIFLVARAREETEKHGTEQGMLRALAVTGGVITSAGIVLAGTFAVLGVLPLTFLTEIGFVVAFGVLLDTFLVRSVLVPALAISIGDKFWWPSSLSHPDKTPQQQPPSPTTAA